MEVKPYKFKDESWGVKVKTMYNEPPVEVGEIVTVKTSTGKSWPTELAAIKWQGQDSDGDVFLCTTKPVPKSAVPTRENAAQEALPLAGADRIAEAFDAKPVIRDIDPNDNWDGDGDLPF